MPGPHYFTTAGPKAGPFRYRDATHVIGVELDPSKNRMPDGMAFPVGWIPDDRGPIATFRLTIGKKDLPGRWVCLGREFLPAEAMQSDERGAGE